MLKKYKHQFIAVTFLALVVILGSIIGTINFFNFKTIISNADETLTFLSQYKEHLTPPTKPNEDPSEVPDRSELPEFPYEARFFSVNFSREGEVTNVNLKNVSALDEETAIQYAKTVIKKSEDRGFYNDYRYLKSQNGESTAVMFLDCRSALTHATIFLLWSIVVTILGTIAVTLLLLLVSGKIITPLAESYNKQKRFIADAGHDIKTPLTIINADAELLELEFGKSEWLDDIKKQTARMTELTTELIYLSKIDINPAASHINFPISDIAEETLRSFSAVVAKKNITIKDNITPALSYKGDERLISKLFTILVDNATKYSPEGETIEVTLKSSPLNLRFKITNVATDVTAEDTKRIFDRFYRSDSARSSSGGFGIGLSIANAIVAAHKGKISAKKEGNRLAIEVVL